MFEHSIIDAQVRWQRMLGKNTLWLPGTDHAGISTQIMVERQLADEGLDASHDLGREKFEARVWEWKEQYGGRILEQMKRAGDSVRLDARCASRWIPGFRAPCAKPSCACTKRA